MPRNNPLEALPSLAEQTESKTEVLATTEAEWTILCLRCGECCCHYQVRLELVEAHRIANGLGLEWEDFWDRYADRRWPGERSLLLRREEWGCPFLECIGATGEARCSIHSFKPSSCREWTPSLDRRECQAGLARRWGITVGSAGELKGPDGILRDFRSFMGSLASDGRI